jgi:hypothetical protein
MVTDIIDKDEPLRNKLRTLGAEIISDIHSGPAKASNEINEVVSFLDIASAMNLVSEMNCTILKKEFLELERSIQEFVNKKPSWLEGFLNSPLEEYPKGEVDIHPVSLKRATPQEGNKFPKGHTRIGVQKGSTLMKVLSDKTSFMSDMKSNHVSSDVFDILKKQRRDNIINIINLIGGNATIKDIKDKIQTAPEKAGSLVSCSEKTLQRELVSMVHSDVLYKTGEKRWSRYFVKN